jgi:hypothetical protein
MRRTPTERKDSPMTRKKISTVPYRLSEKAAIGWAKAIHGRP